MDKENLLILKAKKGDKKAFEQLVNNNMYLVEHYLNKNIYNKNDKDDILQEGYILLLELIKEYINKDSKDNLNLFLHNKIKAKIGNILKKYNNTDSMQECNINTSFDIVIATEQKELIDTLKNIIVGTNTFTFMQKNTLLAKLGFIKNKILTDKELADAFNCSPNNFYIKYIDSTGKLRRLMSKGIKKENIYHMDLSSYFETSKEILIDVINESLDKEEISLLKIVWGDDFGNFNKLEDITLTEEDVIDYYKVIGKLYNIIINLDLKEELLKRGLNHVYALRR